IFPGAVVSHHREVAAPFVDGAEHSDMLENYLPVLIFLTVATGLAMVLMTLGIVIGRWKAKARTDAQKLSPYECGFEAFEDSRMKFDVRYYLVAILFII